ncbi:hypothetical protein DL89DRAFT_271207 [Linderina pennispora]|uniref:Uncharacterized protein n=1 Tax=Linderina pennispora TaxID=61395 RepID=A0A1Y1VVD0_9FUNG|nr:uncharacterized protein DL89DRAFT_271207 [Linderina pennispora]ORX65247.1 hypothetical protein DL89DRAFT_271207 [Linderina pennispora]
MRTATTFIAIASASAFGQEIGSTDGPSIVSAPNAISAPNVNNGWQADGSFFSGGSSQGGNAFTNIFGSSFSTVNSNDVSKGNIVNNPSQSHVKGNDGWTANGNSNLLGPVQNTFSAAGFVRRNSDVVFANNAHQVSAAPQVAHPGFVSGGFAPAGVSGFAVPGFANNGVVSSVFKRNGDVVFANDHHQASTVVGTAFGVAAPQFVQPVFAPVFVQPVFTPQFVHPVVAEPISASAAAPAVVPEVVAPIAAAPVASVPVAAEQNGQKATVIQNQA